MSKFRNNVEVNGIEFNFDAENKLLNTTIGL